MKKILITLILFLFVSMSVYSESDYTQTTMDNHRCEMVQLVFGSYAYNVKFDKWTGNIWLYTKDGSSVAMRDPSNENDLINKQCVYQLTKGNRDSYDHCYVVNTTTGEVWEVTFTKGHSVKYEKK